MSRPPDVDSETLKNLQNMFDFLDADGGGTLSVAEIIKVLNILGISSPVKAVREMVSMFDQGEGELDFRQFVELMVHSNNSEYAGLMSKLAEFPQLLTSYLMRRDVAKLVFQTMDDDGGGELDLHEISDAFTKLGMTFDEEAIGEMMIHVGATPEGSIGLDEFMQMLNLVNLRDRRVWKDLHSHGEQRTMWG